MIIGLIEIRYEELMFTIYVYVAVGRVCAERSLCKNQNRRWVAAADEAHTDHSLECLSGKMAHNSAVPMTVVALAE